MAHFEDEMERFMRDRMSDEDRIKFFQHLIYTCQLDLLPPQLVMEADELLFAGLVKPAA